MHAEKISEIVAHFIGLFGAATEEARMRSNYLDGARPREADPSLSEDEASSAAFASNLQLKDYDPGVEYRSVSYDINYANSHSFGGVFEETLKKLAEIASRDLSAPHFGANVYLPGEKEEELEVFQGPGSVIGHVAQANMLIDDDQLNMTGEQPELRDTSFVTQRLTEYSETAEVFTPFSNYDRVDTQEGLRAIADDMHEYIQAARANGATTMESGQPQIFVLTDNQLDVIGTYTYVNGQLVEEAPKIDDFMPERGIAKPPTKPEKSDAPVEQDGGSGNSLDVAAGANVLANVVQVTETAIICPVTAVMGNYHQIDAISQFYVYSDRDEIASVFDRDDSATSVANNIAIFERSTYDDGNIKTTEPAAEAIFPTAWRVSVIEGDVSFVNWVEQYHFISDNDTMTVTTTGSQATVLTGGNAAVNLASFLGIGMQYDLIIVGGDILDMNVISQIALLYDNDWIRAEDDAPGATVQSGSNLIWNLASIHNVGANDRFEAMPDHMIQTQKAIEDRDAAMPSGLSHDGNFEGYIGLNVLYITGNLYDVNIIKQVSILGDSDDVTQAVSNILEHNQNVDIKIDTGSNAVVNIAQITDYDTFGQTTYLAGQLYSDAILIQGGLVDHDTSQPQPNSIRLANEVIAFLGEDEPLGASEDVVINAGHDLSWTLAQPADVMQTVVA
ncbi:hypothetical protein EV130_112203 [Rhizobium azibense]|uniref:Type I secretion protein n=1 Tax=Rhizobium azibense TaxID=1136135 RepID=A0A4R3QGE4_9HYPH|nr:hypothetical protein [Rhizobium azibense]TCU20823.1 hypothetical protein EV130_112203 [Rhizobium azibense]